MTLDSEVRLASLVNESSHQVIMVSKLKTMWLVDFSDFMTVKVISYHSQSVTSMEIDSLDDNRIITGGAEGTLKITSLTNLEQDYEIYKPRKQVTSIVQALDMLIVGFDEQLHFYGSQNNENLGSCQFKDSLVSVRHIPKTNNLIIATSS